MIDTFIEFMKTDTVITGVVRILLILITTWLTANIGGRLFVKILNVRSLARRELEPRRLITLEALLRSAIRFSVYVMGFIAILLGLGVPGGSIVTAMALFSAGFGFAARPIISDYLTGIIFIFEDQFAVGDKVEILDVVGLVEAVNLRITHIRSTTGELYIVPNGDVRVVRNLSRGLFSTATIKITISTRDLSKAMQVLEKIADDAPAKIDSLIERPEFLSEEGTISTHVELTLSAKAKYTQGARSRTRLMALVTDALNEANVHIIN